MKKTILIAAALLIFGPSFGQIVADETDEIRLDFTQSDINSTLPVIDWVFPSMEYSNSEKNQVEMVVRVSSDTPLKSVTVNIKKTKESDPHSEKAIVPTEENFFEIRQKIYLQNGENIIEVVVENETGGTLASYRYVIVGKNAIADAVSINRKDYALLLATNKYDNWEDLVNPVNDAQTIAKELNETYGFEVEVLENPTQEELLIKIREYAQKKYRPQDQLMIFVAGHGQFDETFGEGYLVASNSLQNDEGKTTYISHNRLRSIIDNIPCEHILLTMDVCFSGTFDPVIARNRSLYEELNDRDLLVRKLSLKTRRYLTSGGKEYVPDGAPGHHSPFAKKLLEAFRQRGGSDGLLTLSEINIFMERLSPMPRTGSFGDNEEGSDFVFVAK